RACSPTSRPGCSTRVGRTPSKPRSPRPSPRTRRCGRRPRRCRSSAAWATRPSTRWRSSSATPRCCRSTKAPARSSATSSPANCSGPEPEDPAMTPSTPSNPNEALILGAVRTPFGRRGGALRETRPDELLATAIGGVLARTGLPAEKVGDVLAGCVSQAGEQGANIARQALLVAGLPAEVPGVSMNRMCGSSQFATHAASQAVAAGDLDFAIGCGVESMSRVPMFLDLTLGQGDFRGFDNLHPKILERFAIPHQVESAERIADQWKISRAEMDDYAIESHRRAEAARAAGVHAEILPVAGVDKAGGAITLAHDEGIRAVIDVE